MNMSAEGASAAFTGFGTVFAAVALLYLARQTKVSHRQAAIATNHSVLSALRETHVLLMDRQMLGFFHDGAECPPGHERHREVTVMADAFADLLSSGLHAHERMPESESLAAWQAYSRHMLDRSPVLQARLTAHGDWWPPLKRLSETPDSP